MGRETSLGEKDPGWYLLRVLARSKRCLGLEAKQAWGGGSCYYPRPGGQELRVTETRGTQTTFNLGEQSWGYKPLASLSS